jgi:HEAT repeat protein
MEPVFGGRVDTAVALRGASALGLVGCADRAVLADLAELLADPEPPARAAAARAIAALGRDDGVPLLRFKALVGVAEPPVLTECLLGRLRLSPASSLPFIRPFLEGAEDVAEAAALALGESRLAEALPLLREFCERFPRRLRAGLLAAALLRRDEAFDWLLGLVRDGPPPWARGAVEALGTYRDDEALRARVEQAVAVRGDDELRAICARAFAWTP